jgi:GDP-D-mannose dehydratase
MARIGKVVVIIRFARQDGAYLSDFLIREGHYVNELGLASSLFNSQRIDALLKSIFSHLHLQYGDLVDTLNIMRFIHEVLFDENCNISPQRHVYLIFSTPDYTADITVMEATRVLDPLRVLFDEASFFRKSEKVMLRFDPKYLEKETANILCHEPSKTEEKFRSKEESASNIFARTWLSN